MHHKKSIVTSLFLIAGIEVFAQQKPTSNDTTIKNSTIEISQIYQPKIKEAVKETINPTLPQQDIVTPEYKYVVPTQNLNYAYKPQPLQALAMGTDTTYKGFHHYVKAGLGNKRTIYIDASLGNWAKKNLVTNAHFGLLSQKGELAYQKQTLGVFNVESAYSKNSLKAGIKLDASHSNFFQYGFDEKLLPNKIATRQTLSGGTLGVNAMKNHNDSLGFHSVFASLGFYTGNNISNETSASIGFLSGRNLGDGLNGKLGINGVSTHLNSEFYSVTNAYISLKAGIDFTQDIFTFHGYLIPTIGQNNNAFLLHDMEGKFHFADAQLNVGAGTKGSLIQNTYQQLFNTNPYISQFKSTQTHSDEVFAFIEKGFGHHLTLSGKVSWWKYENLATFLNQPIGDNEKMMVYYVPKTNALSSQFEMRYQIGNTISVGAQFIIFKYSNILGSGRIWQTPTRRLNGDFQWNPIPELNFNAYGAYVSGSYALDSNLNEIKLKAFIDLGFGAEYLAMKKLSFFINCNNLLNNKYQRWNGYQAYGINIYGGLRLKF
ncbi:MAG: TonB-dependent receptor [Chitinophagaceae bacterium]|jgi:hypothetical protein